MIVIEIETDRAIAAFERRVVPIIPIAAKHVPGCEMKQRVASRHLHDEIDGPTGLASELQRRTGANDFNPFHCVQDWRVMGFRKTKLLVLDRDTVFEHLRELAALRIQAAITEVDNWRLGLFADDNAGCSCHCLSVVVTGKRRELFRFHERSFLAGIDLVPSTGGNAGYSTG